MSGFDWEIAIVTWLASIGAVIWEPYMVVVLIAATFNLWHQRRVLYDFGRAFELRVHEVVGADIERLSALVRDNAKAVDDVKESQIKIAGAFRGRNLPG